MKFLILDTSSSYCSMALSIAGQVYGDTRHIPRQHNKYLLQMISDLFDKAGVDKKSLDFIAYGVGPGSFVGVRLAASVAQAFAVSCDIPIVGFSSMFAIAKTIRSLSTSTTLSNHGVEVLSSKSNYQMQSNKIAVILDAKMGDFYLGLYDVSSDNHINVEQITERSRSVDIVISENIYKLDEYSSQLYNGYNLIGESIKEIDLVPEITRFKIEVKYICEYVFQQYITQKSEDKLTHETYPVYLRGTSLWKTKTEV